MSSRVNALRTRRYGAPRQIGLNVSVSVDPEGVLTLDYELQWWDKPPTRMAESVWMTFAPLTGAAHPDAGWAMDKLGRWVDPTQNVKNGSKCMHAVWSGVKHFGQDHRERRGGAGEWDVFISSLDAPVVSPSLPSLSPVGAFNLPDTGEARPGHGWHFNL